MAKKKKTLKGDEGYPEEKFDADSSGEALTAEEISEKYTVAELKYILKENGLKVSGKKQDLVERVLPILNGDSGEASGEEVADEVESAEEAKVFTVKKVVSAGPEDSGGVDDGYLAFPVNDESLSSSFDMFGIDYDDLDIKDKRFMEEAAILNIRGFTRSGLSMSDYTISVVAVSDSSNVNLKMNIPEVSYSDFESTIFTFKDLDLLILPSSDPQSLEVSAIMDSLEIITENNYVNLKGLDLVFKSFPDENGVCLDIDINSFIYPDFNGTSIKFEDLDFNLSIGLDGQSLAISVNLPALDLMNKDYKVNLSDLNLNVVLGDLKLSDLDLSITLSDFHYTNFDDVIIDMDNLNVSHEPILNSNGFNVFISMNGMDATGLNSFDELFPMLNITGVNIKNSADDSQAPIKLTGFMSLLDLSQMDLSSIVSLLSSGFDVDAYTGNMQNQDEISSDDVDAVDVIATEVSDSEESGFDLAGTFENCDFSGLDALVLDLSGLVDLMGIDLADFGIDVSGHDLSAISLAEVIGVLTNSEFIMSAVTAVVKLFSIDLENIDLSGLIVSFDTDNFDISTLLASLGLSVEDISGIVEMFTNSDIDWEGIFENCDLSCLGAIVLDLTGLIDSLGIDLADLGIDVSDYDLSAISLAEVIGILGNFDFDMSTITALLKLFGLELDDIDLTGLIASFDADNFDLSTLLASLNLSDLDLSAVVDIFNDSGLGSVFEGCDYSCLSAIVLDLTGLLDSAGIDLAEYGIDASDYDLSAIALSDLIDVLSDSDFELSAAASELDLSAIDFDEIDMSGLIVRIDSDFDLSGLLTSLNLSDLDFSAIVGMFSDSDVDLAGVFENCDLSCLGAIVLDLSGLIDSLGIDLADLGIDLSDYDLSAISLAELIGILSNLDIDMTTITALLKVFGLELDDLDLAGLIASFDADNFDISTLLSSLNLAGLDISGIVGMFNDSNVDWGAIFEDCDYSCLSTIVLDLTGLLDSTSIDLADFGIDVSDYDLSAIALSDLIGALANSDFMPVITALYNLFGIDLDGFDVSGLIVSFNSDDFDISGLLEGLDLSGFDLSGTLGMFNMDGFDLAEFLNSFICMFMETTFPQACACELICKSNVFNLENLNELFKVDFIDGQLKVCIDGEVVFEGDTADDLALEIFEITEECLGEHEIAVQFTDAQGESDNYEERIIVE